MNCFNKINFFIRIYYTLYTQFFDLSILYYTMNLILIFISFINKQTLLSNLYTNILKKYLYYILKKKTKG